MINGIHYVAAAQRLIGTTCRIMMGLILMSEFHGKEQPGENKLPLRPEVSRSCRNSAVRLAAGTERIGLR